MKSDLIRINTMDMSKEDWLKYRLTGVGASEVSQIMGLNPYSSSIELFYEKLGEKKPLETNEAMFMGNYMEHCVAELWQYWNDSPESMIKNYEEGNIIRKCRRVNAYLRNPEFPHLFASIDRIINKNGKGKEGVLEIKTISGFSAKQWENELPIYFIVQLQSYLAVTGLEYGEIAILKDGRYLEVLPFERKQDLIDAIIERTSEFWQRVEEAKKRISEGKVIDDLEPEPDSSEAYADYLKERYKAKPITIEGTEEMFETARKYLDVCSMMKEKETEKTLHSNTLKSFMKSAEKIDFGAGGYVSWREDKSGKRNFRVAVKMEELVSVPSEMAEGIAI